MSNGWYLRYGVVDHPLLLHENCEGYSKERGRCSGCGEKPPAGLEFLRLVDDIRDTKERIVGDEGSNRPSD